MYYASKNNFFDKHIEVRTYRDPRSKRVIRKEKVMYHHLKELRETLDEFTYFYYPPLDLHFKTYHTRLSDYTDYDALCIGILSKEDLDNGET